MPITIPMAMAITVSSSVIKRPARTVWLVKYWPTTPHWKRGLVATLLAPAARTRITTAVAIHRPGWRAGIALIRPASAPVLCPAIPGADVLARESPFPYLADRTIDHRRIDGPGLHAPLLEDLLVDAIGDELLERVQGRLRHG